MTNHLLDIKDEDKTCCGLKAMNYAVTENIKKVTCYKCLHAFYAKKDNLQVFLDIAIEEMTELITEILHFKRGRTHNIEGETADVLLTVKRLKYIFDTALVERVEQEKLQKITKLNLPNDPLLGDYEKH
jgi:NTP pyrophosphatase (non-canonical NTP hydrolase)